MPWVQILDATGDGAGHTLANGPWALALDTAGNAFVSSARTDACYVLKVAPAGGVTMVIDETGDGAGHLLDGPGGLGTDDDGNLYVAGTGSDNILQVTPAGVITEIFASTPAYPCDGVYNLVAGPDGSLSFTCGSTEVYRRDTDGTLTRLSYGVYAYSAAEGPNGTLLLNNWQIVRGVRENGPPCTILDLNGAVPDDKIYADAVTAPDGTVYAAGRSKVYQISGSCGEAPDASGRWFATFQSTIEPEESPAPVRQTWNQAGFALHVAGSDGTTYTGTIDDAGAFVLDNDAPFCNGYFCCTHASRLYGTVLEDGIHWAGTLAYNTPTLHGCASPYQYAAAGTRIVTDGYEQCEDENVANGDGCDALGRVEPCWTCDGSVPPVCTAAMRSCSSGGGGGTSLKASADTGRGARLLWKLPGGPSSTIDALGDPTSTTNYALCVFDRSGAEPSILFAAGGVAGDSWRASGSGFSFSQKKEDALQGVTRMAVKSGDRTKATVKAGGPNLVLPPIPVPLPLTVQLQMSDGGCFEASYSSAASNADGELKANADPLP
jgi:cysteine-rich repeat protein